MNQEEFVSKVDGNRKKLRRIARGMVRRDDCEDALQSAILSAWENLSQLRDERAFDAWLTQILINRCRQIQRGYQKEKEAYSASDVRECETQSGDGALAQAMEELSEEQKRLICLHHWQGYTLKEIAADTGESEAVIKMRLLRARMRLKVILISLLLLILLAAAAIGSGMIDVKWFWQNRRAEQYAIEDALIPEAVHIDYRGKLLDVSISDAVWNKEKLTLTFVYSIVGRDRQTLTVHSGNIGVDGERMNHIWTIDGIVPVSKWAKEKQLQIFSLDGWRLDGVHLTSSEDYLPDGLGETFMAEVYLDWISPERYERLLDENGMLTFENELTLKAYGSGELLEAQTAVVGVSAPSPAEWRNMYETYYR